MLGSRLEVAPCSNSHHAKAKEQGITIIMDGPSIIHVYIIMTLCVCVREREKERKRHTQRQFIHLGLLRIQYISIIVGFYHNDHTEASSKIL